MMIKKWKLGLFCLVLFTACKSADCGCPMAANADTNKEAVKLSKRYEAIIAD